MNNSLTNIKKVAYQTMYVMMVFITDLILRFPVVLLPGPGLVGASFEDGREDGPQLGGEAGGRRRRIWLGLA